MTDSMSRNCTKCKNSIPDNEQLGVVAEKYPTCNKCWAEWKEYQIMVMNEMKLDMSMLDHRKLLKKHEKIFVGVPNTSASPLVTTYTATTTTSEYSGGWKRNSDLTLRRTARITTNTG